MNGNTKWRDIIISTLIGVALGVVLITVGFKFIAENIVVSITVAVLLIFVVGISIIVVYRNRKQALHIITGIKEDDIQRINEEVERLDSAVKHGQVKKLKFSASNIANLLVLKYSDIAFRNWVFRVFFSMLAVFGGVITAGLLVKQNQLIKDERDLLSAQNNLIKQERQYLIERNKPKLGVKNNGVTFVKEGDWYELESAVKIENYGFREATEVRTTSEIYEIRNGLCEILSPTEVYESANPTIPGQVISYIHHFKTKSREGQVFLKLQLDYKDELNGNYDRVVLLFRYPTIKQIEESKTGELGLFTAEMSEVELFENCK